MSHHELYDCDLCAHCNDAPAMIGDARLQLDFCSKKCADAEVEDRSWEAEWERQAEITSGGQI